MTTFDQTVNQAAYMREYRSRRGKDMLRFFPYFGSKRKVARYYPDPRYRSIIEPFAGSAGYSIVHYNRDIYLYDIDPIVCGVWNYLINVKESEFLALPIGNIPPTLPREALDFLKLWSFSGELSSDRVGSWGRENMGRWGDKIKRRLAPQLENIRDWKVDCLDYSDIPDREATWFIDPPYHRSGKRYKFHEVDYNDLAAWVESRSGQFIVCEQYGADWLPFLPLPASQEQIEMIYTR